MSWLQYALGAIAVLAVIFYAGPPPTLRAMGFHPHYEIPEFDLAGNRALIVTKRHDSLGETGRAIRLVGALMIEQNHEWAVARRYMGLESLARISNTDNHRLPAVAA